MMVWNGQPDCWTGSFSITMENEFGLAPLWCAALRLVLWAVVVAITIHLLHCNAWYSNVCLLLKGEHNVQATDEQGNFSLVFLKCRKAPPSPHLSIRGSPRKMSICDCLISFDSFLCPSPTQRTTCTGRGWMKKLLWGERIPCCFLPVPTHRHYLGGLPTLFSTSPCPWHSLFSFEHTSVLQGASQVVKEPVLKNPTANAGNLREPGSGRSPGGGHGSPPQYSCLENPMDRGAWRDTVHGVAKSPTQLKRLTALTHAVFWEESWQGRSSRIPQSHVQRFEVNLQQDLDSQGMVRSGQRDQPGHSSGLGKMNSPPPAPPTSPPLPAPGNHILPRKKKNPIVLV